MGPRGPDAYFGAAIIVLLPAIMEDLAFFVFLALVVFLVDIAVVLAIMLFCAIAIAGATERAAIIAADATSLLIMGLALLLAAKRG